RVEYYEDWDEWITQTCTRTCCCDSKGNCSTETYDCSYRKYHPQKWGIVTTTNEYVSITKHQYREIKSYFKNERFIDLNRRFYRKDGDKFISEWQKDSGSAIPVSTEHSYVNKVKAADQSVFHFLPV